MFRSTIGYEDKLSSTGCCCTPEGSGATRKTFQECIALGGYFKPTELDFDCSEFVCPDISEKGCCCSCSYMDAEQKETWLQDQDQPDFGTRDGITPCECTKIGGVWGGVECSEFDFLEYGRQTLCLLGSGSGASVPGAEGDVRWPNACCVYTSEGEIVCRNVCTIDECNATGDLSVFYDDGSVCGYVGPSGQPPRFCEGFAEGGEQEEGEGERQRSFESDYFSVTSPSPSLSRSLRSLVALRGVGTKGSLSGPAGASGRGSSNSPIAPATARGASILFPGSAAR